MYLKCFLIKRVKTICKLIAYIACFLVVFYFDTPIYILYNRQMELPRVNAKDVNSKMDDKLKDSNVHVKYKDAHSDEFVEQKKLDWSAPNKGDYCDVRVLENRDYKKGSPNEYTYEGEEDEYDADEYIGKSKEYPNENEILKHSFLQPNPGLAKLRRFYSIYNYVRGLVPAFEKEVEGWGKNVSRKAIDYINPNADTSTSFISKSYCIQKKPFILIIVCSTPKNLVLRQAIRQTWGRIANQYNIAIFFLVGYSAESRINVRVKQENGLHRDLIIENFQDSYNNLTLKTILMFRWVQKYCNQVPFVMKADDDIYVNLENLYNYMVTVQKVNDTTNLLVGKLVPNATPFRQNTHKWYTPFYLYSKEKFPNYTHGVAYMMSKEVVSKLYQRSFKTDFIQLEDVFITGICAKAVNITPTDQIEFRFRPDPNIACGDANFTKLVVVAHHVNVFQMYRLHWEALRCSAIRI